MHKARADRLEAVAGDGHAIEVHERAVALAGAAERVDDRARRRQPQRTDRRVGDAGLSGRAQEERLGAAVAVAIDADLRAVVEDAERAAARIQPPGPERHEVAWRRLRVRRVRGRGRAEHEQEECRSLRADREREGHRVLQSRTLDRGDDARRRLDWGRGLVWSPCAIASQPSRTRRGPARRSSRRTAIDPSTSASRSCSCRPRSTRPGSSVRCTHVEIPQVAETYAVMGHSPWWVWGFEHGVNEHAVAIGNETVFSKRDDRGAAGPDRHGSRATRPRARSQCARSARADGDADRERTARAGPRSGPTSPAITTAS